MKTKTTPYNDIVDARRAVYEQIRKVEDGEYSLEKAIVLHKLNVDLMEGYRIQAKVFEVMSMNSHIPITITEATKQLK